MLESALVLLTLVLLILGTLDLGQVFMHIHYTNERARAAARWAVVHDFDPRDTTPIKKYAVYNDARARSTDQPGLFGLRISDVTVTTVGSPGGPDYAIEVSISKPLQFFSPYLAGAYTPRPARATSPVESLGATQ
ncbi:MAG: pilus assembly protein [Acidobacteria bacterium]|nr:pilus assembly protein [Acidobacteriota bacterium]MBI3278923.1 pilus assembly protein [Acidobacteriota bacterium]